ncbi:hypothetical protein [Prevotella sp.]|uniref:hypothetical protein n=1 Tax=Prevotella sp. TaxID=59823 RepID=UPI0027E2A350|nr:hypothetical protein [Prevotella sp.]
MIGRVNTGGGGTGGTLTVTAPANVTVTVSKDGKTKTKNSGTSGVVVFKGLASGTWTLTITDGAQTSSKPVVVTADYSTVIAFFTATINITYPAGSTCTCSDGTTTLSAPDTSGTWACIVPNAGTWTVTSTSGAETDSKAVTITTDGQSTSVELSYALFLFKPNAPSDIIAGEWELTGNSTVTAEAELTVKSVNNYNGDRSISARTKGQIDLTEYSTLQATCKASGGSNTKLEVYSGSSVVASTAIGTDLTTVTVDISALSGLHSIGFGGNHTAYLTITYTATEIKLMK